jgi:hypothetical protein
VHIGFGKTGTTAIQRALSGSNAELNKVGIHYLGMQLENAFLKKYDWQNIDMLGSLQSSDATQLDPKFYEIIKGSLNYYMEKGIKKLIISNEWLIDNPSALMPCLKRLESDVNVKIICFVRNHMEYSQSAYLQWGLKHKTYSGAIKRFNEFKDVAVPSIKNKLSVWLEKFNNVKVFNYDASSNVVNDMQRELGVSPEILTSVKANETPSIEELYVRAVYNNQFNEPTLPSKFDNSAESDIKNVSIEDFFNLYLPNEKDINEVLNSEYVRQDLIYINKILEEQGQPLLSNNEKIKTYDPDLKKIINLLVRRIKK